MQERARLMFQEKLRLRLESGEPKCANCVHWEKHPEKTAATIGRCVHPDHGNFVRYGMSEGWILTTDLAVCSKWTQKD